MRLWEPIFWYQFDTLFYVTNWDYIQCFFLLIVALLILCIGVCGLLFKNLSIINVLLSFELILLGVNLIAVVFTIYFFNPIGFLFILILLVLAACESALGISLLIVFYRIRQETLIEMYNKLYF